MRIFLSFIILLTVKVLSLIFYRFEKKWLSDADLKSDLKTNLNANSKADSKISSKKASEPESWDNIKLVIFLNHTSLFEPIFVSQAPTSFLWAFSKDLLVPGADITLSRPITGRFLKNIVPGVIPISRKRDDSWKKFMGLINDESIVAILPEGRMKRKNGLDKHGNPMSVRGGIADILEVMNRGEIIFVYSGGLHHIQTPGQRFPKLFKRVKVNLELMDLLEYKNKMSPEQNEQRSFRKNVINDLNDRLVNKLPS